MLSPELEELLAAAADVADEHLGLAATIVYDGEWDEVGSMACCGALSYKPHKADCPAVRLRTAITKLKETL